MFLVPSPFNLTPIQLVRVFVGTCGFIAMEIILLRRTHLTLSIGLSVLLTFNTNANSQNTAEAPTATAEEAKIRHWREPSIERTFWDITELPHAFVDFAPATLPDGIAVGQLTPKRQQALKQLAEEIEKKQHTEVDSLLIAHQGKLVFESYYSRGRINLSHPQSSTTKSYTALAVGRATQLGYLSMDDLHRPVTELISGLDHSTFALGIERRTLHQLLSMSSGINIAPEKMQQYRDSPQDYEGKKLIQAYFSDTDEIAIADQTFNYLGANPDIVMQVLDSQVPGSAEAFIKHELFDKLGIENFDWRLRSQGIPSAGSGSSMTSRNMMKIGRLVADGGIWQGEQFIPKAFVANAITRHSPITDEQASGFYSGDKLSNSDYGYFWWQVDMAVGQQTFTSHSAQGGGGVTILLVEELELVIVVTAHSEQAFLQLIAERILPLFVE